MRLNGQTNTPTTNSEACRGETTPLQDNSCEQEKCAPKNTNDTFEKILNSQKIFDKIASKKLKKIEALKQEQLDEKKDFDFLSERFEENFIKNPQTKEFFSIAHGFAKTYQTGNEAKFFRIDHLLIYPSDEEIIGKIEQRYLEEKLPQLDKWLEKNRQQYLKDEQKTLERINRRDEKIAEKGKGIGGSLTEKVLKGKTASYFAKNRFTIRGNMFNLNNQICGKSLEEMLPRYGSRKGKHIGIRVSQFTLNMVLMGAGYALAGPSFGTSILVSNQLQTLVTMAGEVIGLRFDGAQKRKMISHATIRGAELECLRIPIVGTIVNYVENGVFGTAAAGIVTTTLADMILGHMSERYTSSISLDDLGEPKVLFEINQRIDYLSRFLLPYGQYLMLNEKDQEKKAKLKKILKNNFRILKKMEHQNLKALNFYRLALLAGRVPPSMREEVEEACKIAEKEVRINSHRTVRKCLAALQQANKNQIQMPANDEVKSSLSSSLSA